MTKLQTRITDLLDRHHIPYRVLPHNEPVYTVEAAAQQRSAPVEEMVKSILLRDKNRRQVDQIISECSTPRGIKTNEHHHLLIVQKY